MNATTTEPKLWTLHAAHETPEVVGALTHLRITPQKVCVIENESEDDTLPAEVARRFNNWNAIIIALKQAEKYLAQTEERGMERITARESVLRALKLAKT